MGLASGGQQALSSTVSQQGAVDGVVTSGVADGVAGMGISVVVLSGLGRRAGGVTPA